MHHYNVARFDAQPGFALPLLEVRRGVNLVIANAQSFKVYYDGGADQLAQRNAANVLSIGDEVQGGIQVGADVQRGRNKLPSHFLEGDALDPANRWPFISSKVGGVHIPVLRQVDYAHVTKINRFHG